MNDKYRRISRWLLLIIIFATGGCLLFQGCSKQTPTEAPTSTVITGTGSMSVDNASSTRDAYSFLSGGHNYGKIELAMINYPSTQFECAGIQLGSGTTAPDSGYSYYSAVDYRSYFIKTDGIPHYGRLTVTSINQNATTHVVTVGFNWVVQTTAGDRNLQ